MHYGLSMAEDGRDFDATWSATDAESALVVVSLAIPGTLTRTLNIHEVRVRVLYQALQFALTPFFVGARMEQIFRELQINQKRGQLAAKLRVNRSRDRATFAQRKQHGACRNSTQRRVPHVVALWRQLTAPDTQTTLE